jgi:peptidoglycan/LPS O-acetylase OafA/YrhL
MLKKITGPGLFRLFLALLVYVNHATRLQVGVGAVMVFFCLSGYWICRMYEGRYSQTRRPYLTYLASRAWRLMPTFWLLTLVAIISIWLHGNLEEYWAKSNHLHFVFSNLFFFGYWSLPMKPILPAWSLDIEMQFYVIAPILVIILAKRIVSPAILLSGAFAVSFVSLKWIGPGYMVSFTVFFLLGMVAASTNWKPSGKLAALSFLGTALLIGACLASPIRGVLLAGRHPSPLASTYAAWTNYVLALCLIPYALYTTNQKGFRLDGMFADMSYIVYLLHPTVLLWMNDHLGRDRILYDVIGTTFLLLASVAIWQYYDRPINRIRSRWVNSRKKPVKSPVDLSLEPARRGDRCSIRIS